MDQLNWLWENAEPLLTALGALSTAAALFAALTPNKKDDSYVAKARKVLDFLSLSIRKEDKE
jgi:hypothetical protein